VLGEVVGDAIDRGLGLADLTVAGELSLEVRALIGGKGTADALKPGIDALAVHVLLNVPAFIKQRNDRPVPHSLIDGIDVDDTAELRRRALLLLLMLIL